ncbi:hypothetical protein ACOI1C_20430, partial [Bacillus sp. DJP31]
NLRGGNLVSKDKEKVIHVDELIIYAKEVKIISPRIEEEIKPRNPSSFFSPRRNRIENLDVEEETTTLVKGDLVEEEDGL